MHAPQLAARTLFSELHTNPVEKPSSADSLTDGRLTQARALSRQRQSQFPPRSVRVQSPHLHRLASKKLRGALSTELDAGAAPWDRAPGQRGPGLHGVS